MTAPSIYRSINAVARQLAKRGLPKSRLNEGVGYNYRSIDDIVNVLAPLLANNQICVLPRALDREITERRDGDDHALFHVALRTAFEFVSAKDGSSHVVEAWGEALDEGDKATAKASTAAFKAAMIQAFCIPFSGAEDSETGIQTVPRGTHSGEPIGGWEQWCHEIEDVVSVCESSEAIDLVQERYRELLKSVSRERPDLYRELGKTFTGRREVLTRPKDKVRAVKSAGSRRRKREHLEAKLVAHA